MLGYSLGACLLRILCKGTTDAFLSLRGRLRDIAIALRKHSLDMFPSNADQQTWGFQVAVVSEEDVAGH